METEPLMEAELSMIDDGVNGGRTMTMKAEQSMEAMEAELSIELMEVEPSMEAEPLMEAVLSIRQNCQQARTVDDGVNGGRTVNRGGTVNNGVDRGRTIDEGRTIDGGRTINGGRTIDNGVDGGITVNETEPPMEAELLMVESIEIELSMEPEPLMMESMEAEPSTIESMEAEPSTIESMEAEPLTIELMEAELSMLMEAELLTMDNRARTVDDGVNGGRTINGGRIPILATAPLL
ncbi:hypothetical protein BC936DRAFT_138540 [Jimgerdemannia flammicorona]|uniref:Uncharacterized protein n=1 Tax=Jimgerdemannia flammicorona TaxID=994334 RepID=A0A433C6L7_9FUNG|nr:hypothetical protein BC936DRAFT_138540 [Jimgerdemannia flammicorona]